MSGTYKDGWHGVPGCAGCINPVNMQHVEGCALRARDAGHRHVTDFVGRSLYVGDAVVAVVKRTHGVRGNAPLHHLTRATVAGIGTGIRVTLDDTGKSLVLKESQLMKVRQLAQDRRA